MTLEQHIQHLHGIFGERNDLLMRRPEQRLAFLTAGIRRLEDAYEEEDRDKYGIRLASVFARWCAIVAFLDTDKFYITQAMAAKYGGACAYCKQLPCDCPRKSRAKAQTAVISDDRLSWGLREWQGHLGALYGEKNQARGMDFILRRLFSEEAEAMSNWFVSTLSPANRRSPLDPFNHELLTELCDVLAWTIAAANMLNINLEDVANQHYGQGCPSCKSPVCKCTVLSSHSMSFRDETSTV